MAEKHCNDCGCNFDDKDYVVCTDVDDKQEQQQPEGLAFGKKKIFHVNMEEDGRKQYAIFQYYTEYGTECVVNIRLVNPDGSLEAPGIMWLPMKALIPFVHWFENELQKVGKRNELR